MKEFIPSIRYLKKAYNNFGDNTFTSNELLEICEWEPERSTCLKAIVKLHRTNLLERKGLRRHYEYKITQKGIDRLEHYGYCET